MLLDPQFQPCGHTCEVSSLTAVPVSPSPFTIRLPVGMAPWAWPAVASAPSAATRESARSRAPGPNDPMGLTLHAERYGRHRYSYACSHGATCASTALLCGGRRATLS